MLICTSATGPKIAQLLLDGLAPYCGQKQLSNRGLLQLFLSLCCWIGLRVANNQTKLNQVTYVHNIRARSLAQWLKRSSFKRMIWGSIPYLAAKWVTLVTLNMCGSDNMSIVA